MNKVSLINNQQVFTSRTRTTKDGNPYYHSNIGLKVGAVTGTIGAINWLSYLKPKNMEPAFDFIKKFVKGDDAEKLISEIKAQSTRLKKYAIPFALIAGACSIGCGILVDHLRNKNAQKSADIIAEVGDANAPFVDDSIDYTKYGTAYHKSKQGSKLGALLGLGCGVAHTAMVTKKPLQVATLLEFALAGWLTGLITDKITNKKAAEQAKPKYILG